MSKCIGFLNVEHVGPVRGFFALPFVSTRMDFGKNIGFVLEPLWM